MSQDSNDKEQLEKTAKKRSRAKKTAPNDLQINSEHFSSAGDEAEKDLEGKSESVIDPQSVKENDKGKGNPPRKINPAQEYCYQVYFDRSENAFLGTVLEFPEFKAMGLTREDVMHELQYKVEAFISQAKKKNETIIEPVFQKKYPAKMEIELSQGLFRKLDLLSRYEKTPIERLVAELIANAIGRRFDNPMKSSERFEHHNRNHHQRNNHNSQQHRNSNHNNRRNQNRNFHETMDNRENFMEYVRNLEKGGGPPGNWKKNR